MKKRFQSVKIAEVSKEEEGVLVNIELLIIAQCRDLNKQRMLICPLDERDMLHKNKVVLMLNSDDLPIDP